MEVYYSSVICGALTNLFAVKTIVGNRLKIAMVKRGLIALLAIASIVIVDGAIGALQEEIPVEEFDVDSAAIDYGKFRTVLLEDNDS